MFERLKHKWKVNNWQLILILCVFAITGTCTAFLTRQISSWLELESSDTMFWVLKLGILLIGYWILLLLVAIPFGQFAFFWNFEKRFWGRIWKRKK